MMWDLGDDVNFLLACKEQELDDNMAYEQATMTTSYKKLDKTPVQKAESVDNSNIEREYANDSLKNKTKGWSSFNQAN